MKDYYGATYPTENTPPDRWIHGDISPKPMITHSPKKLDPAKTSEIGVTRILNRDAMNGGGSNSFEVDPSNHSGSPEYHQHFSSSDHSRHTLSERSYSHHSDPGVFLRKDHSWDLGSPLNLPAPHLLSVGLPTSTGSGSIGIGGLMSGVAQYSDDNTSGIGTPPCSLSGSHGAPCPTPPKSNKAAIHANAHIGTALVGMKLDVGSIWFGTVSIKPVEPIIVHENGLKIHLVHKEKGKVVL